MLRAQKNPDKRYMSAVYLTPTEHELLMTAARSTHRSLSSFMRYASLVVALRHFKGKFKRDDDAHTTFSNALQPVIDEFGIETDEEDAAAGENHSGEQAIGGASEAK